MAEKKTEELILDARNFFNAYKKEIGKSIREGKNVIYIDFNDIASFSHKLAELLIAQPEEILQVLEVALEESGLINNPRVRLLSLPEMYSERIRNLRAKHLNKLIQIEGIVRQASEVRPQVVNAKFECPSCGTIISVLQIESKFREPNRCSCGRKGRFRLVSKDMVDAQRVVVEESPESLVGGEQPRRISVFLKEDLVEPKMEERTTPGSKVRVVGILKEIPRLSQAGGILTRYDIAIEANNIIPLEETFEELDIDEEDERQIKELAADPKILDKLIESIAPSVYGHEEIKKSLVLQLFGGIKKYRSDGTQSRGDIHVLLVGDPGVAKSVLLKFIAGMAPKGRYVAGKGTSIDYNEPLLIKENNRQKFVRIGEFVDKFYENKETGFAQCQENIEALSLNLETLKLEWQPIKAVFRHKYTDKLLSFSFETGRKIKVTKDHSIFCIENGEIKCKPSQELKKGDYILIPKIIPSESCNFPEEMARFLGYFIAEGHLYNKNGSYKILFTLNKNEMHIASEIQHIAEKYLNKEAKINPHGKNSIRVTIYGKEPYLKICSLLGDIAHKSSLNKGVPEVILNSNPKARESFFEGYMEGDAGITKSPRLMSELLYLKLQDQIIASCIETKMNKVSFIEGRKILQKGSRFDLKSPRPNRKFRNLRTGFPVECLPENLKRFFKKKLKSGYSRIDLTRIDNKMLFERIMRVFREKKVSGKRIRELFGENSLEYFSDHSDLFSKEKKGREIIISLTEEGKRTVQNILKLKKLLEADVSFVKIQSIEEVSPEGKFVYDISTPENENFVAGFGGIICHNTGAGLTATVVRDEFLRGWSLEAGAMVLGNKGIVCVDEIEKMSPDDRSAMHEALEQQTVTISKANVQACLRAETSVLAAANPKFGRFDPYQTVASQIDIPPTLINRFDVIFILKDNPDRAKDEAIATHVLMEHKEPLVKAPVEKDLFRKYIAYAKQKIFPKLTDEAIDEIKKFYVELRNMPVTVEQPTKPLPISARQLEALIRLSEASARTRLSKKVEKQDAKIAIDLMKYYLMQVGYDYETKTFDIDRIATGVSTSQRGKIILVRETLARLESRLGKLIPIEEIKKELEGKMDGNDIDEALEKLTISGDIFHPRKGFVQRM